MINFLSNKYFLGAAALLIGAFVIYNFQSSGETTVATETTEGVEVETIEVVNDENTTTEATSVENTVEEGNNTTATESE